MKFVFASQFAHWTSVWTMEEILKIASFSPSRRQLRQLQAAFQVLKLELDKQVEGPFLRCFATSCGGHRSGKFLRSAPAVPLEELNRLDSALCLALNSKCHCGGGGVYANGTSQKPGISGVGFLRLKGLSYARAWRFLDGRCSFPVSL